jgi:uncharacterized membrane protein YbhN (UPF0104 family)
VHAAKPALHRPLRVLLGAFLTPCILVLLLAVTGLPDISDWRRLATGEQLALGLVVALATMAGILLRGLRWIALLPPPARLGHARLLAGFGWSFLVLQALPFRTGEVYRPLWFRRRGGSATQAAATVVLERVLDLLALGLLLLAILLALPMLQGLVGPTAAVVLMFGAAIAVAACAVLARRAGTLARRLGDGRLAQITAAAVSGFGATLAPRRAAVVILLTALIWLLGAAAFATFLHGTLDVSWLVGVGVLVLVNLSGVMSVTPGHMGVFEAVAVAALVAAGVAPEAALVTAVGLHVAVLAGVVVAGLLSRLALLLQERR